jgi:hypothetical protein
MTDGPKNQEPEWPLKPGPFAQSLLLQSGLACLLPASLDWLLAHGPGWEITIHASRQLQDIYEYNIKNYNN